MAETDRKNLWLKLGQEKEKEVFEFARRYKNFMDDNRTEREFIRGTAAELQAAGFKELAEFEQLKTGDRVYAQNREGAILAAIIGENKLNTGLKIVGAHVDSPRIDLKPKPLFEEKEMAFFTTHYYGGVRKYQWVTIPLALRGVAVKEDGTKLDISIGMDPEDPIFYITDLLPHFAKEQNKKKLSEAIDAAQLNSLVGTKPVTDEDEKEPVKKAFLNLIKDEHDLEEEDLISAELQLVPAIPARDVGLDRTLLAAYGHDDRSCSYTALQALLELEQTPAETAVMLLVDREEVGSMGNTGMQSSFFENTIAKFLNLTEGSYSDLDLRQTLENSTALSGDVTQAFDPDYPESSSKHNAPYLNQGVVMTPYTGARGKGGSSEASAEFKAYIRGIWNKANITWQAAEMGAVDKGGGGTIAQFLANLNLDVLDCGPAVLSMHAPYEVISKADLYMTKEAYRTYYL
ncbi:MAG: aminopeptidase [Bacillota bacterium]